MLACNIEQIVLGANTSSPSELQGVVANHHSDRKEPPRNRISVLHRIQKNWRIAPHVRRSCSGRGLVHFLIPIYLPETNEPCCRQLTSLSRVLRRFGRREAEIKQPGNEPTEPRLPTYAQEAGRVH